MDSTIITHKEEESQNIINNLGRIVTSFVASTDDQIEESRINLNVNITLMGIDTEFQCRDYLKRFPAFRKHEKYYF